MADDDIVQSIVRLEEVLSHDDHDIDDNRLARLNTSPLTQSHSPRSTSNHRSNRNLMATSNPTQLVEENRYLNDELNRVETMLNLTRAEKDELSIRYNALSDRLEQALRAQGVDIGAEMMSSDSEQHILVQQNIELRRKLEEEHQNYKRKLSNYQEGQLKQAELVQKLQQKVLQYKSRCTELELLIEQHQADMDRLRQTTTSQRPSSRTTTINYESHTIENEEDQDMTTMTLESEKQKSINLTQLNTVLRDQIDQAHLANQQLSEELRRVTVELNQVRDEYTQKTRDWKEEERVFNQYYNKEHNLMYELWRDIVSFRKQFTELKGTTERDLMRVRNDLAQTGRSLTSACFGFLTTSKAAETQGQAAIERERNDRTNLESQIREKSREIADLKQKSQDLAELNEKLRLQLAEKDGTINTLARAKQTHQQATVCLVSPIEIPIERKKLVKFA
ncbi:unnamed protein product [Adineta ricciae]|uniref:Rootletin-like coiled-coil domain-containing protein n=2 Tax=Adineta ricciae TaxID=249248 RepID=A0A814V1Y8_ADIRI|nr:unnamed protein product [Adineta ricciae]